MMTDADTAAATTTRTSITAAVEAGTATALPTDLDEFLAAHPQFTDRRTVDGREAVLCGDGGRMLLVSEQRFEGLDWWTSDPDEERNHGLDSGVIENERDIRDLIKWVDDA